jgi:glycosyltransferase involved in cell wall biosynthesis
MQPHEHPKVSIILPCLNEAEAIPTCIAEIASFLRDAPWSAEVIVVNNGSTDGSAEVLELAQATFPKLFVVYEPERGYGNAYLRGFNEARGDYILMADMDTTYNFKEIGLFVDQLDAGADFVIGNRFSGNMARRAMPIHHQFIGNPLLSFLVRLFFKTTVRDVHCGMRALKRSIIPTLNLKTAGMEFASEMVIKAVQKQVAIAEVPISYNVRTGTSKLRSLADGWRHMRFMLLYSPLYLFLLPGALFFILGFITFIALYFNKFELLGIQFIVHPIFISSLLMIIGYQLITFTGFAKAYAVTHLGEENALFEKIFRVFSIEKAGIIGLAGILGGLLLYVLILHQWVSSGFGSLNEIKNAVAGLTLIVLGIQTISSAFMTSILGIKEH